MAQFPPTLIPGDDAETVLRRSRLVRVFNILNNSSPDQTFSRPDLFGDDDDTPPGRRKWGQMVMKVLRAQGFVGVSGNHSFIRYHRERSIPTDERIFQMCMSPKLALDALASGTEPVPPAQPELKVVAAHEAALPVDEAAEEGLIEEEEEGEGEEFEEAAEAVGELVPLDADGTEFNPQATLLAILNNTNHIKSRMTVLEHRLMELQGKIDDLFREWTGGKQT